MVIRDQATSRPCRSMSAIAPIADKRGCGWFVRFVPKAGITPVIRKAGLKPAREFSRDLKRYHSSSPYIDKRPRASARPQGSPTPTVRLEMRCGAAQILRCGQAPLPLRRAVLFWSRDLKRRCGLYRYFFISLSALAFALASFAAAIALAFSSFALAIAAALSALAFALASFAAAIALAFSSFALAIAAALSALAFAFASCCVAG